MSLTQSWLEPLGMMSFAKFGEDRTIVIAVGRGDGLSPDLRQQIVFTHEAANLLVVHDSALLPQGRHRRGGSRRSRTQSSYSPIFGQPPPLATSLI